MPARIIDGTKLAKRIKSDTSARVHALTAEGRRVRLAAIIVGEPAAAEIYTRSQRQRCQEVGIEYQLHSLPPHAKDDDVRSLIRELNQDSEVTGIILQLPLPPDLDTPALQYCIDPYKDVEGVNPSNIGLLFYDNAIIAPCTALAVMEILKEASVEPRGLNAVVVGQGAIAGRPISLFLSQKMATVTSCHIATKDLYSHTRQADLLVVAVGKPGLIRGEHVKPGAIVIDVGINSILRPDGSKTIVGDVDFTSTNEAASIITPVPGGVGPVTVAILLRSAVEAAAKQTATPRRLAV
ncbi:MAG: bifunctional 5,10-methylenetetrahydrofolate dehydrogenase/5,10-methenyltetrahydrofolate cyclohydrolase [Planctomycetes bacterium]|nr:bifunctional 5,10-methylenetetrahydrofolate dehydrogenase/5,10-methenyltetrahydrofolate cyclohydrolase [Planctomycetota bacterium]MBI3834599.1 bifunctional 5,10-methylenetetrahydrofolate dehydrogenase/5,10-methenyltetrahydrofolate cyclohydrolase [Planctomycetota bacterium]